MRIKANVLYVVFLFLMTSVLFSCIHEIEQEFCANELYMRESILGDWPTIFTLPLPSDTVLMSSLIYDSLKNLSVVEDDYWLNVNLKLSLTDSIQIGIFNPNEYAPNWPSRHLDIFISRFNEVILEQEFVLNDSLEFEIIKYLRGKREGKCSKDSISRILEILKKESLPLPKRWLYVDVNWDNRADRGFLVKTLDNIRQSINVFYEEMSMQYFNKSICQLDSIEIHAIKNCQCVFICEPLRPTPPPTRIEISNPKLKINE